MKCRSGEVVVSFCLSQVEARVDTLPDRLLPSESQSEVDPVESHPVQVSFPLQPIPPHKTVAGCADVLVIAEPNTSIIVTFLHAHFLFHSLSLTFIHIRVQLCIISNENFEFVTSNNVLKNP